MSWAIVSNGRHGAMTKPDLLFGREVSLQPSLRRLLFESTQLPIQCWLERLACGTLLERFSGDQWEEILLIQGGLDCSQNVYRDICLCLPPERSAPPFCAGSAGAVLLRLNFRSERRNDNDSGVVAQGKPPVAVVDFSSLAWNEIPAAERTIQGHASQNSQPTLLARELRVLWTVGWAGNLPTTIIPPTC